MPSEAVVDVLRRDILDGVFAPGERLIEVDLSERYRCGRAAIRSALLQLETEVLVDRKANKGAVVRRIPIMEAVEISEARRALESLIAARAARRATSSDDETLNAVIEEMTEAVASDDAAAYATLNKKLHRELMRISDHAVAADLVANLRDRGVQNQFRLAVSPERRRESLEQHGAIVAAVLARDEEGAARAMSDHLDSVIEVLSRWATDQGAGP